MESIASQVERILDEYSDNQDDPEIIEYKTATEEFNSMVKEGLLKPRGNNLCLIQGSCAIVGFDYNKTDSQSE
jgi:hypothetical protein